VLSGSQQESATRKKREETKDRISIEWGRGYVNGRVGGPKPNIGPGRHTPKVYVSQATKNTKKRGKGTKKNRDKGVSSEGGREY